MPIKVYFSTLVEPRDLTERAFGDKMKPMDYITKIKEERTYESKQDGELKAGSLITRCLADIPAKSKDKQFKIEDIPSIWDYPWPKGTKGVKPEFYKED